MPRMEAESTDRSPENGDPASRLTLGVRLFKACMAVTLRDFNASLVKAVRAIGTSCSFSSRRCAVTMTSCSSCAMTCAQPSTAAPAYSACHAYARTQLADERPIVFPPRKDRPEVTGKLDIRRSLTYPKAQ